MLYKKKLTALLCVCALVTCTAACAKENTASSAAQTTTTAADSKPSAGKVELKSYRFPEFFNDIKSPDMLANPVFSSFDINSYVTEVEEQPFEDYECTALIGDTLYVYKSDRFAGLLNKNGDVVLAADTYASVTAGSAGFLVLSRDKELNSPDDHAYFDEAGNITMADKYEFSAESIYIREKEVIVPAGSGGANETSKTVYEFVLPDGSIVSDGSNLGQFDSIEPVDMGDIDTTKVFGAYYKAFKDGFNYFVCFDKYYNFTIFNGTYGYIRLKVGEDYGECYILDGKDYTELNRMLESFGDSGSEKAPGSDQSMDFIQIELGYNSADRRQVTISADGYCLTDFLTANEQPMNKYFSRLDKESFVSLVLWVDQVLAAEYEK